MVSDRGLEYINEILDLLFTKMRIKWKVTTPYHPNGNGKCERVHRFINDIIAKGLQDRSHTEWDELVQPALFAIRTCVHDSSRYTPFFLTYGRDPIQCYL